MIKAWLVTCIVDDGLRYPVSLVVAAVDFAEAEAAIREHFNVHDGLESIEKIERIADTVIDRNGEIVHPALMP